MTLFDLVFDGCFLLLGIAGTVFVIANRKRLDMWISLPACMAWVLKGARHLCFDCVFAALDNMEVDNVFLFVKKANLALEAMDSGVMLLLCAALARMAIIALYSLWYRKAIKSLDK